MSRLTRLATLLQASLIADSLTLPGHWIYDPAVIQARFGRIDALQPPPADGYHHGQPAGGQTHYGLQALALMEALGGRHAFDADAFLTAWTHLWQGEPGYRDGATRATLTNLAAGKPRLEAGSDSDDLGGAARMAPLLVALDSLDDEAVMAAAVAQTRLTHRDPGLLAAAAFIARSVRFLVAGAPLSEALAEAAHASGDPGIAAALTTAQQVAGQAPVATVQKLGPACPVTGALPATLALALTYPDDLPRALVENTMAGGDSAARGLVLGMLLGAVANATLPPAWLAGWQARERVEAFLAAQGLR